MSQLDNQIFDVIIIGSGVAGINSAWPIVKAGKKVLMLDVGYTKFDQINNLDGKIDSSPKVRAPEFSYVFRDFKNFYNLNTSKFSPNGSLAMGGLSNAWSALVSSFTNDEFDKYPFNRSDIINNYDSVAKRIGISGEKNGDLVDWLGTDYFMQSNLPIHPFIEKILKKYEKKKISIQNLNVKMGRHHQAILSSKHINRPAFSHDSMDGYKNTNGSVYNSADEIPELKKYQNFKYLNGYFVKDIMEDDKKCNITAQNIKDMSLKNFNSKILILAAGTIGSTKLILKMKKYSNKPLVLKNTPMYPFAIFFPTEFKRNATYKAFTHWHMSYVLQFNDLPERYKIYGHLTPTDGIDEKELINRIPLPSIISKWITKFIWPKMILGTCIFPGFFSKNQIELDTNDLLKITGNTDEKYISYVKKSKKILSKTFRKLGGVFLTNPLPPILGSDCHYASTLPMTSNPKEMQTNENGLLYGNRNIYIVDGSVLTELPAKSHTFTIMANADRISKHILKNF